MRLAMLAPVLLYTMDQPSDPPTNIYIPIIPLFVFDMFIFTPYSVHP